MDALERWKKLPEAVRADVLDEFRKEVQALRGAAAQTAKEAARANTINLFEATAGASDDLHKKADGIEIVIEMLEEADGDG